MVEPHCSLEHRKWIMLLKIIEGHEIMKVINKVVFDVFMRQLGGIVVMVQCMVGDQNCNRIF